MLRRIMGRATTLALAALSVVLLSSQTAYAHPGVGSGVIVGNGNISPGLTATPTSQTFTFTGDLTGVDAIVLSQPDITHVAAGTAHCTFGGTDPAGSIALGGPGAINAGGSCTGSVTHVAPGGTTNLTGTLTITCRAGLFIRVGGAVVVQIDCTLTVANPGAPGPITINDITIVAGCAFEGGPVPPITTFQLQCAVEGAGVG
jgi:hypothetical protein